MELRHLRYFVAVAQAMSFREAARRLHLSQPPLSKQIQELEEEIGVRLFYRYKRSIALTEAGELFLAHARRTLDMVEQAVYNAREVANGQTGLLRIGFIGAAMYQLLPPLLKAYHRILPKVEIRLQEGYSPGLIAGVENEDLSVAIVYGPVVSTRVHTLLLAEERLWLALPEDHPCAVEPAVSISKLAGEEFILHPQKDNPPLYEAILNLCQAAGFTPHIAQETTPQPAQVSLVAAGMGICFVTEVVAHQPFPGVVFRPLAQKAPVLQTLLVWKRSNTRKLVETFVHLARERRNDLS
jgi:DNA-binding transcriptional LysR family regulator